MGNARIQALPDPNLQAFRKPRLNLIEYQFAYVFMVKRDSVRLHQDLSRLKLGDLGILVRKQVHDESFRAKS